MQPLKIIIGLLFYLLDKAGEQVLFGYRLVGGQHQQHVFAEQATYLLMVFINIVLVEAIEGVVDHDV